ncbi:MAG: BMP family protein [Clostridiales bacterium]|nr:BMP family protein [Clostridiales bacterium]
MKLRKVLALMLALVMALSLAACSGGADKADSGDAGTTDEGSGMKVEDLKVALILNGSITDGSWNANGYNALKANADELGFEMAYVENVQEADMEANIRDFCENGYNLIIGHGGQFEDPIMNVAPNYPDVKFFVYNGTVCADNVCSEKNSADENAFITGAIAAYASETGVIGWIGAVEVPTTAEVFDGYKAGAEYAVPGIEVLSAYVGSYNDTAKAKELALTMIEQNADVIQSNANQGTAGIIEAANEKGADSGLKLIGNTSDQYKDAPEFMLTSCTINFAQAYRVVIDNILNGEFKGEVILNGVANGVMGYADYHDQADALTDEEKAAVEQIAQDITDGKLNSLLPCDYSEFGRSNE